jgi:hypothetical protein
MEDTVRDCIEDEAEGSTHASNRLPSLCTQSITQTRRQARIKSSDQTPSWVRFYQHLQNLAAYKERGYSNPRCRF